MKYLVLFSILLLSLLANSSSLHVEDKHRYFGGLSEVKANLPKSAIYSAPVVITAEVFSAKDDKEFNKAIEEQTQEQKITKKIAKEFLENNNGHLFNGLSEGKLNISIL